MMGVTRQQHTLNEQGYSERFKVACRLIQIQSAKSWAFHIPTMFLQRTIGRPSWHTNHVFYYGLHSLMAPGQQRSPLIHINSANAIQYIQAFLCLARTLSGEGDKAPKTMQAKKIYNYQTVVPNVAVLLFWTCSPTYLHTVNY